MNLELLEQNGAYLKLLKDIENNAVNHAYIFIGEDGEVRKGLFTLAAMTLLCKNNCCGECSTCVQISTDNYVDIMRLDGNNKLKVDDITKLTDSTCFKPVLGDRKLYFIDNADKLSVQAQNKLLKTFEEPSSYVTIILGVTNENGLLNTIKSRGKKLYLELLSSETIINELTEIGVDEISAQTAAAVANGNYEKALLFSNENSYSELYDACFNLLLNLKNSSQIVEYLYTDMFSKENISLSLDFLEIILNDCMKIAANSKAAIINTRRAYDLNKIAETFTPSAASVSILRINEGRKKLNVYVNSVAVAEEILFAILEAKYKWQR